MFLFLSLALCVFPTISRSFIWPLNPRKLGFVAVFLVYLPLSKDMLCSLVIGGFCIYVGLMQHKLQCPFKNIYECYCKQLAQKLKGWLPFYWPFYCLCCMSLVSFDLKIPVLWGAVLEMVSFEGMG